MWRSESYPVALVIDTVETAEALAVAREAAQAAVEVVLNGWSRTNRSTASQKSPRDLVTEVDRTAEETILERLGQAFPEHAVEAEESGGRVGSSRYRWIVDPLDGTTNYVHHFPMFAVSLAMLEDEVPVVGVVVDPVRGEWFTARAGSGARLDRGPGEAGRSLSVSKGVALESALIATGFPFRHRDHFDRYMEAFRSLFHRISDMRRAGSAALDLAYVSAGRVDGFWEIGLNPWDIAAGEVLVREAGGEVSDWTGGETHRKTGWITAGSKGVHQMLIETLSEFA